MDFWQKPFRRLPHSDDYAERCVYFVRFYRDGSFAAVQRKSFVLIKAREAIDSKFLHKKRRAFGRGKIPREKIVQRSEAVWLCLKPTK